MCRMLKFHTVNWFLISSVCDANVYAVNANYEYVCTHTCK